MRIVWVTECYANPQFLGSYPNAGQAEKTSKKKRKSYKSSCFSDPIQIWEHREKKLNSGRGEREQEREKEKKTHLQVLYWLNLLARFKRKTWATKTSSIHKSRARDIIYSINVSFFRCQTSNKVMCTRPRTHPGPCRGKEKNISTPSDNKSTVGKTCTWCQSMQHSLWVSLCTRCVRIMFSNNRSSMNWFVVRWWYAASFPIRLTRYDTFVLVQSSASVDQGRTSVLGDYEGVIMIDCLKQERKPVNWQYYSSELPLRLLYVKWPATSKNSIKDRNLGLRGLDRRQLGVLHLDIVTYQQHTSPDFNDVDEQLDTVVVLPFVTAVACTRNTTVYW